MTDNVYTWQFFSFITSIYKSITSQVCIYTCVCCMCLLIYIIIIIATSIHTNIPTCLHTNIGFPSDPNTTRVFFGWRRICRAEMHQKKHLRLRCIKKHVDKKILGEVLISCWRNSAHQHYYHGILAGSSQLVSRKITMVIASPLSGVIPFQMA